MTVLNYSPINYKIDYIKKICLKLKNKGSDLFVEGDFYDIEDQKNFYVVLKKNVTGFILYYYNNITDIQEYKHKNLMVLDNIDLIILFRLAIYANFRS